MSEQNQQLGNVNKLILGEATLPLLGIDNQSEMTIVTPWYQGGSETFVTDFIVHKEGEDPQHLIAKACIKLGAKAAMSEWLTRRNALKANGVETPNLITLDDTGATLIEEFIPLSFKEAYINAGEEGRSTLRHNFISTYLRIEGAGFKPKSLHDVRSRGSDVVVIDMGEDLGGLNSIDSCSIDTCIRAEMSFRNVISAKL